jgi:hypothetical protein
MRCHFLLYRGFGHKLPSDRDKEFVDEAGRGSVAPDAASPHAPLSEPDQAQPTPAGQPVQTDEPLDLPNAHARLPLDRDSLTFAVVGLKSSTDGIATTETIAATDAHTATTAETVANIETAAVIENTETIAETDANTFDARIAKPKRRSRKPQRGSAAGAGGAAPPAAVANTETIAETDANTQPVFEHSDQMPVEKQPQSEPASDGFLACADDYALRHRAVRTDLILRPPTGVPRRPIVERIGILCRMVVAVASVIVLLFSYEESLHDSVLPLPTSLAWRSDTLVAEKFPAIGSAKIDDKSVAAAAASLRPVSLSEIPNESQQPPWSTRLPPNQSALKAEVTLGSVVNEPTPPIPPATDAPLNAAPIPAPPSAAPAPSNPAMLLDNDEIDRLIKRGKDFLKEGDFAAARLLLKRAADAGSAEAALALGSTYDPSVIKQLGALSITPDLDRALKWYEIATDRGSADAADRYANLKRAR